MTDKKILLTGATGQVARPVAERLAEDNEVWCVGRFTDPGIEQALVAQGIKTWRWDMGTDPLDGLPRDFTHVMHSAAHRGDGTDFDAAVGINSTAVGRLMAHCVTAKAFLHVSTGAVYARQALDHAHRETDALGGRMPWLPTYPVGKLAAEGAVRAHAVSLGLPTIIARLNVAYGPYGHGGVPTLLFRRMLDGQAIPVPAREQNWCNPIHTDDIARQVPLLWAKATVPARIVNWGGDEMVGLQDMMTYVAQATGVPAQFAPGEFSRDTNAFDNTERVALIGRCAVGWQDGVLGTLQTHFPAAVNPLPAGRTTDADQR
jgi:nucleoside-diphosphate-sugar epimerase